MYVYVCVFSGQHVHQETMVLFINGSILNFNHCYRNNCMHNKQTQIIYYSPKK